MKEIGMKKPAMAAIYPVLSNAWILFAVFALAAHIGFWLYRDTYYLFVFITFAVLAGVSFAFGPVLARRLRRRNGE